MCSVRSTVYNNDNHHNHNHKNNNNNINNNNNNNNKNTYLYSALMRFLKNTVIPLLNTHRSYTGGKVFIRFLNIVMESALWIFRGSSFHNLAAEVPETFS